jgi:hypothetical protein
MMVRTCAARQALSRLAGPAVKFSIAGTRPDDISPSTSAIVAFAFGISTPTASAGADSGASARPRTAAPVNRRR